MRAVVDQARDVFLRHLGELLLEDALEAGQDDQALARAIVVDDAKLDIAVAFFDDGRLLFTSAERIPVRPLDRSDGEASTFSGKGMILTGGSTAGAGDAVCDSLTLLLDLGVPGSSSEALRFPSALVRSIAGATCRHWDFLLSSYFLCPAPSGRATREICRLSTYVSCACIGDRGDAILDPCRDVLTDPKPQIS